MSPMRTLIALLLAVGITLGFAAPASAVAPAYTDVPWTNDMNQASYWNTYFATPARTVACTKYESHNGFIPAAYDAAVIKDASTIVRVYSDLTNVGDFQGTHPQKPEGGQFSIVMKCKFTPVATTTTEATTTTIAATTTTVAETTTTAAETTTTVAGPTTTAPATTQPATTAPATTQPIVPAVEPVLPSTGSENWIMALIAGLLLLAGTGAIRLSRRS